MNILTRIIIKLFETKDERRKKEWNRRINEEVLTDDLDKAKFVVFQSNGAIRLVEENLFTRICDCAITIDYAHTFSRIELAKMHRISTGIYSYEEANEAT